MAVGRLRRMSVHHWALRMHRTADLLLFSSTDLTNFLECAHLTHLELQTAAGFAPAARRTAEAEFLAAKGDEHERAVLSQLEDEGPAAVRIDDPRSLASWADAARQTECAMRAGARVIHQAVLLGDGWRGKADFLVRVETPSSLGRWSYEAWDAKLARHAKPKHVLQLAYYSERIAAIQRREPEWTVVVLGSGERVRLRVRDVSSYYRAIRGAFVRAIGAAAPTSPYPVAHCRLCTYHDRCEAWWISADHLSLVANIRRSQVDQLVERGISTVVALTAARGQVGSIAAATVDRLRHQASLQAEARRTGEHRYELLPPSEEHGFRLLPPPSPGDVFFDMEGYPFFEARGGLEYLFGAATADERAPQFRAFVATDRAAEKRAFEQFVDFVWARLRQWPDLHVYHYAHYEPAALKRLMSEHAAREEEVDELLRREVFVDLYQVVRRSMRISHDSYSLKAVRRFFMPDAGRGEVAGGVESIVEFQRFLDTGDASILDAIQRYNEEDCVSTLGLRDWLLARRDEAQHASGVEMPFRALPDQRRKPLEIEPDLHADLRARLAATGLPHALLIGHLLDYHRREAKPEWWAYFERKKKSLDELLEDTQAISHLTPTGAGPQAIDQSLVHVLAFPPQEFKLKIGDSHVEGPLDEGRVGTIEWIDEAAGRLGLRRGRRRAGDPLPRAVVASKPVPDKAQRAAIERVAEAVARGDRRYRAFEDILAAAPPRFRSLRPRAIQTLDLDAQKRLAADLDDSCLFVQGPPGSGKTWTGARLAVALIAAGKRVGVTGPSHRAIHNLLEEIERVAVAEGVSFEGVKKRAASEETAFDGRFVRSVDGNEDCERCDAQLVAGTAWLFAREGMDHALDYLFVDEAGQMALADAVAVGTSARSIVLLGDPQQLPHVTQTQHPEGSGRSVLEHLLDGAHTVGADRGVFLAQSWRMHPDLCAFVSDLSYDGRLTSAPGCERQRVSSPGLAGAGLRYLPVEHRHNAQQSPEEAAAIAAEIDRLLQPGAAVVDRAGVARPLTASDILVVAPYNMQVRCLRDRLPPGVEVGTVDRFQGREAAVVFFSMASSSGDEAPRGLAFLFDHHRFNVALSRAKCLAIVACSPRLLEARCRTVDDMRLVNALCRFAEAAASAATAPATS